jgi:hypothetical protein
MCWTAAARAALAVMLTLPIAGCTRSQKGVRRIPDLNVLLITIDTLRADAVGRTADRAPRPGSIVSQPPAPASTTPAPTRS